jgi:hypothetical protein
MRVVVHPRRQRIPEVEEAFGFHSPFHREIPPLQATLPQREGKRRWRARDARRCGLSAAGLPREAPWSAERQFRFLCSSSNESWMRDFTAEPFCTVEFRLGGLPERTGV